MGLLFLFFFGNFLGDLPPEVQKMATSLQKEFKQQRKNAARVRVEIYGDYFCDFCETYSKEVLTDIRTSSFAQKNNILFSWHFLPVHEQSRPLARATVCAFEEGEKEGWALHDALFALPKERRTSDEVYPIIEKLKMDANIFHECLISDRPDTQLKNDFARAREKGILGTPTILIGENIFPGIFPKENIKHELRKAMRP